MGSYLSLTKRCGGHEVGGKDGEMVMGLKVFFTFSPPCVDVLGPKLVTVKINWRTGEWFNQVT